MAKKKEVNLSDLTTIIEKLNETKKPLATSLLNQAIFCEDTLNKLKSIILNNGFSTDMSQGKYSIKVETPELKSYNTLIKNYNSLIKNIYDILKGETNNSNDPDPLEEFNNELH